MTPLFFLVSTVLANGNAITFDGTTNNDPDQVVLGTLNPGPNFTVESWVQFDAISDWNTLVEAVNPLSSKNALYVGYVLDQWQIEANDNSVWEGDSCSDGVALCTSYTAVVDTPTHVAVSVSGADITLIVDGIEEASGTLTAPVFGSLAVWGMGADSDNGSAFTSDRMDGMQDELRIWSRAFTAAEVQCTMHHALTGNEPNLYAHYPLDDAPGSATTTDATGGGHDGTLYGDADFVSSPFGLTVSTGGDISCFDFDEDGVTPAAGDCDDTDAAVLPGTTEVCDGIDNDCDGTVDESDASDALTWYADTDADGFGDATSTAPGCSAPSGYVADATDCDDTTSIASPGAIEYCDGIDNDCDGTVDEDDASDAATWNIDHDGDGFGSASYTTAACSQPSGFVSDATDCEDMNASAYPGATEVCDGVDNSCDGTVDGPNAQGQTTFFADDDGDGFGDASSPTDACEPGSSLVEDSSDCDDTDANVNTDATEVCDGVDNDCDGSVDEDSAIDASTWYTDADGDGFGNSAFSTLACSAPSGWVADNTDCHDGSAAAFPGGTEVCDSLDNDCDGIVDEPESADATTWYTDADSDGFGDSAYPQIACTAPSGAVEDDTDCDDSDGAVFPGAVDAYYDGVDANCDGASDYDADLDGHDSDAWGGTDCDDTDADIHPDMAETWYDGVDSDCDEASDFDADRDGFDSASYGGDDCDDANPDTFPGAPDTPHDGVINDCNLTSDNDADGDGHDSADYGGEDCDDNNSEIHPEANDTWYDGIDSDCDGADDFDQDGDGFGLEDDCDDTDPLVFPGAPGWNDDCEEVDTSDTGDTGAHDSGTRDTSLAAESIKGGGGCGCSANQAQEAPHWVLMCLAMVGIRRRGNRGAGA